MHMGVNHLGHFYLTYLLWKLIKTSNPRIINVASEAHRGFGYPKYNAKIDFNDMSYKDSAFKWTFAYTRSKIANILFTRKLQVKMKEKGIKGLTFSLEPGVVTT